KKGSLTTEPVQTQFGWHVIRLDDVRETAPPPLAEVRTQIVEGLQRQKLSNFQQSLRGKAEIK
ncbi:MAG: peptidylprolyl isomerase, partial [Burkholderiaceae bacterium]